MWRLEHGTYRALEELGRGVSSIVYLVIKVDTPSQPIHQQIEEEEVIGLKEKIQDNILQVVSEGGLRKQAQELKTLIGGKNIKAQEKINSNYEEASILHQMAPTGKQATENEIKHQTFALKSISLDQSSPMSSKIEKQYQREITILGKMRHPGVIRAIDHGEIQQNQSKSVNIVMEWGRGGFLKRLIELLHQRPHFQKKKETILTYYFAQIVQIIAYLQQCGISHRDIKAQNFVLSEDYKLKVIDFAVAEVFDHSKALKIGLKIEPSANERGQIGSKHYISPEMIRKQLSIFRCSKTDIWAIGILMYYMWTKSFPFDGRNTFSTFDKIKEMQISYDNVYNEKLIALLKIMLMKDPQQRASISQIKNSAFFQGVNFSGIFQAQSPILKILKTHKQQYYFRGEAMVKINGQTKRRIVGWFSRRIESDASQLIQFKQEASIFKKEASSVGTIQINQSDFKASISDNKIPSSEKRIDQTNKKIHKKMYLSIAKLDANSIPKQLQLGNKFKAEVKKDSCSLSGFNMGSSQVQQPIQIEVKFKCVEQMDAFWQGLQTLRKEE